MNNSSSSPGSVSYDISTIENQESSKENLEKITSAVKSDMAAIIKHEIELKFNTTAKVTRNYSRNLRTHKNLSKKKSKEKSTICENPSHTIKCMLISYYSC